MKKACMVTTKYLQNNVIFNSSSALNRDGSFDKYIELKKRIAKI